VISFLAVLALAAAGPEDVLVVQGGRIITVSGAEIPGGRILISGGRIRKIGPAIDIPEGAAILDISSKTVCPGLIDAASTVGIEGSSNENGSEVTPDLRILDMVDPASRELARARQAGITTLFIEPGNRNVIGGLASIVHTHGIDRAAMTLRADVALKGVMGQGPTTGNYSPRGTTATFFARRPTTRMAVVWEFRKAFAGAREGTSAALRQAMEKKLPVRVAASRATDIESLLKIADDLGLRIVLEEGQEAYKVADELAARRIPVLLRPEFGADGTEGSAIRLDALRILSEKGVVTALLAAQPDNPDSLLASAALAVKHGSSREEALRAVTLGPARILGVEDRIGSLEEGKDADLVVLSGDPLDVSSRVDLVLIGGRVVFDGRKAR
jgi:imidazolonepropionase-like amidohydrolase